MFAALRPVCGVVDHVEHGHGAHGKAELFHEKKRIKSNSIRIEYNNEVINLDNFDNWFMNMITPYLDKYLGVSSLEEAQEEEI